MENLKNVKLHDQIELTPEYVENCCTMVYPNDSEKLLRIRHDFLIVRNGKVLLYPKMDTVSKYCVSHKPHTFILPGVYPYNKNFKSTISDNIDVQKITAEYIVRMSLIPTKYYINPYVDLYDTHISVKMLNSDNTVDIYGDYVYTHIMKYDDMVDEFYIKEPTIDHDMNRTKIWKYDFDDTSDKSFNMGRYFTASVNDTPIWVGYNDVLESSGNNDVVDIVEYFVRKYHTKDSVDNRVNPMDYLEHMIDDFIYHTPIFSYSSYAKLMNMSNLFKNIAIVLPCMSTIDADSPYSNIIDWLISQYDGNDCKYTRPSVSEYFHINLHPNLLNCGVDLTIYRPSSLTFYKEIQVVIDIISGIIDYINNSEKYKDDLIHKNKLFTMYTELMDIFEVFVAIIPTSEVKIFGKNTTLSLLNQKNLTKDVFK